MDAYVTQPIEIVFDSMRYIEEMKRNTQIRNPQNIQCNLCKVKQAKQGNVMAR